MLGSLATFGYASKELDVMQELCWALAVNPAARITDTRLVPRCAWAPRWNRDALSARFGRRYLWRGDWLGNLARGSAGSVRLAAPARGIPFLVDRLQQGETLILLCACAHYERCHRRLLYERVKAYFGARFPEYQTGMRVRTPDGAGMIDPLVPIEVQRARHRYAVLLEQDGRRYYGPAQMQANWSRSDPMSLQADARRDKEPSIRLVATPKGV
jgi:hypothetical protein